MTTSNAPLASTARDRTGSDSLAATRLGALLDVTRLVRSDADLPTLLAAIARAISESLGFQTVALTLYRPAWDDFCVATVHGNEAARDALVGGVTDREFWRPLLDERFLRRGAYVLRRGDFDWARAEGGHFVPDGRPAETLDTWDPEDALFVPLRASDGELLGVLSVDEPLSGSAPSDDDLDALVALGNHAALAVEQTQAAAEAAHHRTALEQVLRISSHLTGALSLDALVQSVCEAIRTTLGFENVSLELVDGDGRFHPRAAAGWALADAATPISLEEVRSLLDPAFEREGCFLLSAEAAEARVPPEHRTYASRNNGRGPHAWNRHWLVVPLSDRSGELAGFIWADEPEDRLLPSTQKLQALRMFANQVTTALDFAEQFEVLRKTNERHRALVASAPLAIVELDPDARVRSWNAAAEHIFGWSECEAVGSSNPVVPEDRQEEFLALVARVMAGETFTSVELRHRSARGDELDVLLSAGPLRDSGGRITGVIGAYTDVSDQRRAEEALRQSQELYRKVLDTSNDVIAIFDMGGQMRYVSPAQERILGHRPEELLGQDFASFIHPEDAAGAAEVVLEALSGGFGRPFTARIRDARGGWRLLEGVPAPIRDESGRTELVVAVARDVTERMRAEDERRALEEQLRQAQKLEAIGRLAGGIAHDFNNLLTAIGGYAELALARLDDADEVARRHVEDITRASERASGLTRQLLAFGRKQMLQPRVIDLNEVVGDVQSMLGRLIGEEVSIVTALEPALGCTKADPSQIEQVVVNLALNARDAMPCGGRLTISTANAELDEDYAARHVGAEPGSYVVLAVSDTGDGMDAATQAQIFEPFFTTKGQAGTGLGLATVYGIVKQSGGGIWVYSEPGRGSSFKVYLPRIAEAVTPARPAAVGSQTGGSETILLVEDESTVRSLVREMLEIQGYRVLSAARADDALALVAEHEPVIDLLVTDVVLPDLSGPQLAARLVARHAGLQVLFTSGYAADAFSGSGGVASVGSLLEKPFSAGELAARVRSLLDSAS